MNRLKSKRSKNIPQRLKASFLTKLVSTFLLLVAALTVQGTKAQAPAEPGATAESVGAVFAMTNRADDNEVVSFARSADGRLTQVHRYSTGGNGIGVDFDTQGGLRLSKDNRFLYACNPGSDNVTVFAVNGTRLTLLQKVYAGDQPLSITLFGNLA